jgi:hypothetical protein
MNKIFLTFLTFFIFNFSFSQLRTVDCSRSNISLTQQLFAAVSGATQYKFRVQNLSTGAVDSVITATRSFSMTDVPSVGTYNCSYDVRVAMNFGSGFGAYSAPCFPSTAPLLMTLRSVDCGKTLLLMNSPVWASIDFADSWDFEIRLANDNSVTQLFTNRPTREFRVTQASAAFQTFDTEIQIRVRSTQGGVLQPWGLWCSIFTPSQTPPEIIDGCNTTFEYLAYEYITCTPIDGATQYRWRLRSGSSVVDLQTTNTNQIRIADFLNDAMQPAYDYNRTYNISAQVFNGSNWSNYGPTCSVTTTAYPHAEVQHLCDEMLTAFSRPISVFAIFNATSYEFQVIDNTPGPENDGVQNITLAARSFKLTDLSRWSYGHEYSIRCRVVFKSVLQPWSEACSVYAPLPIAALRPVDCPKVLTNKNAKVYSNIMESDSPLSISGYQFKIGSQESVWKSTRDITLQEILGSVPDNNTTYQVQVRIMYEGTPQPYGAACAVTTPSALIVADDLESDSLNIETDSKLANLQESTTNDFIVYPNPSEEYFTVSFFKELENETIKIEIYDFSGRLLMSIDEQVSSDKTVSFGSELVKGNYLMKITSGGSTQNRTIIKL